MPEHLEVHTLDKAAQDLLENLGKWLEKNGVFAPGIENFERCTSEDLGRQVGDIWGKVTALFNQIRAASDTPKYWGISRAQRGGGWMTNERGQLLVPVRVTGNATPYIASTATEQIPFEPGKAIYFAPGKLAFIGDNVEFFFIH